MGKEKLRWKRPLSFVRGPFRFHYIAHYEATESDEFWTLVLFQTNGHEPIEKYPPDQRVKLVEKYGPQAARAAHEEAEKLMRVGRDSNFNT